MAADFSPRAQRSGVLAAIDLLAEIAFVPKSLATLEALIKEGDLPAEVGTRDAGLKYDLYLARDGAGDRWGVTINDRWERDALPARIERFVAALGAEYATEAVQVARGALDTPESVLTFAVGYDHVEQAPRLKYYIQEDRWGQGVAEASDVRELAARLAPRASFPGWLDPARRVGVVTVELRPEKEVDLKLYLGAASPVAAARGAPERVVTLARILEEVSPLSPAYYYLTVRLQRGRDPAYAINKIYNAVHLSEPDSADLLRAAWQDVGRLFRVAGHEPELWRLREHIAQRGLAAIPTATALQGHADSADVYFTVVTG